MTDSRNFHTSPHDVTLLVSHFKDETLTILIWTLLYTNGFSTIRLTCAVIVGLGIPPSLCSLHPPHFPTALSSLKSCGVCLLVSILLNIPAFLLCRQKLEGDRGGARGNWERRGGGSKNSCDRLTNSQLFFSCPQVCTQKTARKAHMHDKQWPPRNQKSSFPSSISSSIRSLTLSLWFIRYVDQHTMILGQFDQAWFFSSQASCWVLFQH